MAIDRNVTININDISPSANTAYVDAGKENKVYNKAQVNELVEDLREGALGSISPSQTLEELNALEDGNYYASEAGDYAFGVIVPVGWQYRFSKIGTTWKVLTKVEMPMQDLTPLENRITTAENKVDDFIDNFAVEVDQEFDANSENAQSGKAIDDVVFGAINTEIKTDITSTTTVVTNKIVNPASFVIQDNTAWDYLKIAVIKDDEFYYETNGGAETTSQNIVFQSDKNDVISEVVGIKTKPYGNTETIKVKATKNGFLYFNKRKSGFTNPFAKIYSISYVNESSNLPPITESSLWGEVYNKYALKSDSTSKSKMLKDLDLLKSYTPASGRIIDSNNILQTANNNSAWRNIFVYELLKGQKTTAKVKLAIYPNSSTAKTLLAIKTDGTIISLLDSETEVTTPTEREVVIPSDVLFISITQRTVNLSSIYFKINAQKTIVNNNIKNTSIHSERELLPIKANGQFNWNSYSAHQSNIVVDKLGNEYLCIVDENKYVNVLKKDVITKQWSVYNFQGKTPNPFDQTIDDNHNVYSISIDDNGYILLTGNMHASDCKSVRSKNPYDITSWVILNYSTGLITYPRFVKDNNGKVYLFWREGGSGSGDTYYCYFDSNTLTYSAKIKLTDGVSVNVNAYEQRIVIDSNNVIHYCYCVRGSSASANTNVGMYYMKSDDGISWKTEKNTELTLPITHNINGNRVFQAESSSGLVNQNGSCVDGNNNFHTVFWQYREKDTQIIHLWFDGTNWISEQLTDFNFRIDLSSGGLLGNLSRPQIIYSKSTNKVYAMYRTFEMNEDGQIHFIDVESREKISIGNFMIGQMELQYYQNEDFLMMIQHDMVLKDGNESLKSNKCFLLTINI